MKSSLLFTIQALALISGMPAHACGTPVGSLTEWIPGGADDCKHSQALFGRSDTYSP
jgi:hypothetical protein